MSVKVRLRRMGNKNRAFYRIIASDGRNAPTGKFVENIGWYDPRKEGVNFKLDAERVAYWQDNGAQFSATVTNLIKRAKNLPPEAMAEPAPEKPAEEAPAPESPAAEEVPATEEAAADTEES